MVSPSIIKIAAGIIAPTALGVTLAQVPLPIESGTLNELVRAVPVAVAMIVIVWMFLRHLDTRDERLGHAIDRLTDSIDRMERNHDSVPARPHST